MMLKKEILEQLSKDLLLPYTGIEQDWDLEMANSNRIDEFLGYYNQNDLSLDWKVSLMSLILTSYDDFLNENDSKIDNKWSEIKSILESEGEIFNDLINYWSLSDEAEKDNLFQITPLIRNIKEARSI